MLGNIKTQVDQEDKWQVELESDCVLLNGQSIQVDAESAESAVYVALDKWSLTRGGRLRAKLVLECEYVDDDTGDVYNFRSVPTLINE